MTIAAVLLALFMFGIGKAALMPMHRWLPAAMVAPTPVSALLHAVAVVKAGVFTVSKVMIYVFGLDLLTETGAAEWLVFVAAFSLVMASVVALTKGQPEGAAGLFHGEPAGLCGAGRVFCECHGSDRKRHAYCHACGRQDHLFFCAGAIYVATHKTEISDMAGIGRIMPVTMFAFLIGSLSIIGCRRSAEPGANGSSPPAPWTAGTCSSSAC